MNELDKAIAGMTMAAGRGPAETVAEVVREAVSSAGSGLDQSILTLATQVGEFSRIAQQQGETVAENTLAVVQNTTARGGSVVASMAGNLASSALKNLGSGLSLVPLVSSLVGLFRGKKQEGPAALAEYTAPDSIHFDGAASQPAGLPIPAVDYGQDGMPRLVQSIAGPVSTQDRASSGPTGPPAGPSYAPSVTVQVQAMDSRSFLDHSDEIARAVREAILNSHSLSDVVGEI